MPTVVLLTVDPLPFPDLETPQLAAALEALGIKAAIVGWADPALARMPADLFLIRSTWDYHHDLTSFLNTLEHLPAPVLNPLSVVRWNSHKGYLVAMAAADVPVIPTTLVSSTASASTATPSTAITSWPQLPFTGAELIIKPAISASAIGVGRFPADDRAALLHLQKLAATSDVVIQPFAPGIADGERSLIFFEGIFSHAVRKVPASNDFRVQFEYGGQVSKYDPSARELEVASLALACAPDPVLYARVDLVDTKTGPQVMELELIEPELFLSTCPGSAARFAAAIAAHLPESAVAGVPRVER